MGDESFPRNGGMSVNAATTNIPLEIHHDGATHIAQWGLEAASRYPEDVMSRARSVTCRSTAGSSAISQATFQSWILSWSIYVLPFGWTGSPVHYSIAGQAIRAIHNSRPGFQNLVYCDDHILIGDGRRFETQVSGIALRRAMVTVLGTTACNEKKLTWQRQCRALGLIFDFES
jgi:hypothetical protein